MLTLLCLAPWAQAERIDIGEGKQSFTAFIDTPKKDSDIAFILLPDKAGMAADPNVLAPLREELGEHYMTLGIDLTASEKDNTQRLQASFAYLKQHKAESIYLIGYGYGGQLALQSLAEKPKEIAGVVLLSAYPTQFDQKTQAALMKYEHAVLDITAEHDFEKAMQASKLRQRLFHKADKTQYQNFMLLTADHYYSQLSSVISKRIRGWVISLKSHAPS